MKNKTCKANRVFAKFYWNSTDVTLPRQNVPRALKGMQSLASRYTFFALGIRAKSPRSRYRVCSTPRARAQLMNHLFPRMKSPFYVNFFNIPLKWLTLSAQRGGVMSGEFLTGFAAAPGNNSASTRARIFLPCSPSLILRNDITRFITM